MSEPLEVTGSHGKALDRYLSPIDVCAMAFGCMVGWGVFAMPGNSFLPIAGPAGTLIAMLISMVIVLVIGSNISYLMGRSSLTGGVYTYIKDAFGRDHSFLCAWFLCLSYLTIVFLNGTALFYIVRVVSNGAFQGGLAYTIAGNTIYLSETVVSALVLIAVGFLFVVAKPLLRKMQTVLGIVLFVGIVIVAVACLPPAIANGALTAFGTGDVGSGYAIFSIVVFAPWAFVGFEVISFDTAHFKFPIKKSKLFVPLSIVVAAFAYASMALASVAVVPDGFSSWQEYIGALSSLEGVASVPTFYAAESILGQMGFEVETADNGQIAVEKVSASEPGYYDAILMDIQMPVMDGYSATRAIRALDDEAISQIPILAMTANAFQEDVQAALDAGMQAHIAKPIDINVLISSLKAVL